VARRPKSKKRKRRREKRQKREGLRRERLNRARSHFDVFDTSDEVVQRWIAELENDLAQNRPVERYAEAFSDALMSDPLLSSLRLDRESVAEAIEEYRPTLAQSQQKDEGERSDDLARYVAVRCNTPEFRDRAEKSLISFIQRNRRSEKLVKAALWGLFVVDSMAEATGSSDVNPLSLLLARLSLETMQEASEALDSEPEYAASLLPAGLLSGLLTYLTELIPEDAPPTEVLWEAFRFEQMWHFAEGVCPLAGRVGKTDRLSRNQFKKLAVHLDKVRDEALPKDLRWEALAESRPRLLALINSKDPKVTQELRQAAQTFCDLLEPTEENPWERPDLVSAFLRAFWCYMSSPPVEEQQNAARIVSDPERIEPRLEFVQMLLDRRETTRARRALQFVLEREEANWRAKSLMAKTFEVDGDWPRAREWLDKAIEDIAQDEAASPGERKRLDARQRKARWRIRLQTFKFW